MQALGSQCCQDTVCLYSRFVIKEDSKMCHFVLTLYRLLKCIQSCNTVSVFRYRKTRKPGIVVPFLPLTFIVAYLGDMAYGTKMKRIRGAILMVHYLTTAICWYLFNYAHL